MKRLLLLLTGIFLLCGLTTMGRAQQSTGTKPSSTQRQKLREYVEALQTNPNDVELRQKIVKLAATLKPPPTIPEEARRYYVKAVTLQKQAKTAPEVAPAIAAYEQALLLAPWWADAYYNVSSALELAGRYPEAITALKLYLATNPRDARAVQDRIYGIEGEQEQATAETSARAQKETEEKAQQQAAQQRRQKAAADEQARQQAELQRQKMQHFLEDFNKYIMSIAYCQSTRATIINALNPGSQQPFCSYNGPSPLQLPGDGTVVAVFNEQYLKRIVGTPRGPSLEETSWQCAWANGQMTPAFSLTNKYPVQFPQGYFLYFVVSCDDNGDASQHHYNYFSGPGPERWTMRR